ncbi:MAG: methylcobamide--CoM methyltransferase MtbA [Methylobacter sp.]|nr:MAG: methylcobamide--CoM methyltransferase MtbA [Methylobacter sp.]
MNSMQRVLTTMSFNEPDRVPLFLFTGLQGARELDLSIEEYFSRSDYVVEGQMRLLKKYRGDCISCSFYAAIELEAWGGDVIFQPDCPPNAGPAIIRRPEDIDRLQAPHVSDSPVLLRVLETIQTLKARVGDTVPIVGTAISPFSLPVMQMGFDHYLELIYEQPDRLAKLMRINEDFCVEWANAQLTAGATAIGYADPVSSVTVIPRELYLKTGQQVAKRTIARINGSTATHLASGRSLPIIDDIAATGTAGLGVSALEDLATLKTAARGKLTLIGNLNGVEMRRWTVQQAEQAVKCAIAKAGRGGGFILSDNHGEIPWQVPDEILLAIVDACERWGNYPLDWIE